MSDRLPLPKNAKPLSALGVSPDGVKLDELIGDTLMIVRMEWLNRGEEREGVVFYCHRVIGDEVERQQLRARGFTRQSRRVAEALDVLPKNADGKFSEYPIVKVVREGNAYALA